MFKTIKTFIKITKANITIGRGEETEELLMTVNRDGKSINIFNAPQALNSRGAFVAGAFSGFGGPCIVVDNYFSEMSESAKVAILEHEIGHIMLGHVEYISTLTDRKSMKKFVKSAKSHDFEDLADSYASTKVGLDIAYALQEVIDTDLYPSSSNKEMKKRIERILTAQ